MSGLILAFFFRANHQRSLGFSSLNQIKAESLSRQALAVVVGHLKNECGRPSHSDIYDATGALAGTAGAPYLYIPKNNPAGRSSMLPEKVSPADSDLNVIKLLGKLDPSDPGSSAFYSGGPALTSSVSTNDTSLNGRKLDFTFWNSSRRGPQLGSLGTTRIPGWSLITKGNGCQSFNSWDDTLKDPSNPNYVIGRFAFVAYDVGGLININQAGYPSKFIDGSSLSSADIARKGSFSTISLNNLPGLDVIPEATLNKLLYWRSPVLFASNSTFLNFLDADTFVRDNGWLSIRKGENQFLSRSELIRYARLNGFEASLPYMTVFNRQSSRPSWTPINTLSTDILNPAPDGYNLPFDYEANANASRVAALARRLANTPTSGNTSANNVVVPVFNRNMSFVRWPQNTTIRTWDWDSTNNRIATRTVKAGDPVMRRRFPLSKIELFKKYRNASTSSERNLIQQEILACFGLLHRSALSSTSLPQYAEWIYAYPAFAGNGTSGNATASNITRLMTLDELPNVGNASSVTFGISSGYNLTLDAMNSRFNREPNFFEILMAGILESEMGEGVSSTNVSFPVADRQKMAQTHDARLAAAEALRIGANIIDQYDDDNYPTLISFTRNPTQSANTYSGSSISVNYLQVVAGLENLPCLSEVLVRNYRASSSASSYKSFFEFELWNPHQNAGQIPAGGSPQQFRVVATDGLISSGARYGPLPRLYYGNPSDQSESNYSSSYLADEENTIHQIRFQYPAVGSLANPTLLRTHLSSVANSNSAGLVGNGSYQDQICGIFAGETPQAPHTAPAPSGAANAIGSYPYLSSIISETPNPPTKPVPTRVQRAITYWATAQTAPTFQLQYKDTRPGAGNVWVPLATIRMSTSTDDVNKQESSLEGSEQDMYANSSGVIYNTSVLPATTGATFTDIRSIFFGLPRIDPRFSKSTSLNVRTATPEVAVRPTVSNTGVLFYQSPTPSVDGGKIVYNTGANYRDVGLFMDNRAQWATGSAFILQPGRDGVPRPADGYFSEGVSPAINSQSSYYADGVNNKESYSNAWLNHRPYILNRPYRSVGELSYVYRSRNWKTINFSHPTSSEAGLLDLFCVQATPYDQAWSANSMNLNSMPKEVIAALIKGSSRNPEHNPNGSDAVSASDASSIAEDLRNFLDSKDADKGYLLNRSELVSRFGRSIANQANGKYPASKIQREVIARSLGEIVDTSTWNLLIDLVAQTGRYPKQAGNLANFVVEGEQRYWLHLAIDRLTGEIIDQQLEPSSE